MKIKILVFPCGSEIGLEIHRSLQWCKNIALYGASSATSNHGKCVYKNYIEDIPFINDPQFLSKLNEVIRENKIDFVYPAHDSVVLTLAENQDLLACDIIGSPVQTCQICRSKLLTYQTFQSKLRVPKVYSIEDRSYRFPVFLKPNVGQGSKGIHIANSVADLEFYLSKDPTMLMLEFLPGREFTIDCFTDRHSELRFAGARERVRIQNGISVDTHPVESKEFEKLAEIINYNLRFRGGWFFQIKETANGELALMEIAPRIAGTMGLCRNLGVNIPLLSVFDRLDIDVDILCNSYFIEMDRALYSCFQTNLNYQHVYIDLDDSVIIKNKVNVFAIAFLYQCFNKGIKRHLLSRHLGDIYSVLRRYRLEGIFDTITQLKPMEEKANFIKEPSSIFFDDSFSERQKVFQKLGIPTFDLDAIESLLDWKA